MKILIPSLALLLITQVVPPSLGAATFFTPGNKLMEACGIYIHELDETQDPLALVQASFCQGSVAGVSDTISVISTEQDDNAPWYCLPNNVTLNQIIRVAWKYMGDHPEDLHKPASNLIMRALHEAFPCR